MERLISGEVIKQLRLAKNMTQAELADEICSERTLRRIENGEHCTNQFTFELFLEKLSEDTSNYLFYSQNISQNKIYDLTVEIRELIDKRNFISAREVYNKLRKDRSFALAVESNSSLVGKIYRQFSFHWEALFLHNLDNRTKEALEMEHRALNETIKNFTFKLIEKKFLTVRECAIINAIAGLNFCLGNPDSGIEILTILKTSLNKSAVSKNIKSEHIPYICYNLSKFLAMQKRYSEANLVCDEGIEICESIQSNKYLGYLYYNKAKIIYHLNAGDYAIVSEYFLRSYYAFMAAKDDEMIEIVKRNAIEKYCVSL